MKKLLVLTLLFLSTTIAYSQENRLALVIGNADYAEGALRNPVNDANLIAQTLDSLNFDVILGINLKNAEEMKEKIREFGSKRDQYNVAFIYYAGHAIEIEGENYMLPTEVAFESEFDVEDNAVSVQKILRYINNKSEEVNSLVLDACRDNPFESNWNQTRSLTGKGLAKIEAPSGSLIAFSTEAGRTAADGTGVNSLYCEALCRNIKLQDVSLDQVFRNVRKEVVESSSEQQRPIESSQLTGNTFFMNPIDYNIYLERIDNQIILFHSFKV